MRCGVAAVSAVVLVATALGWYSVHGMLGGINVSSALGADAPRSSGGEMNILLIGLDSRKDQQGNDLPPGTASTSCTRGIPTPVATTPTR